jgi:AcrR family transcriptional regulator
MSLELSPVVYESVNPTLFCAWPKRRSGDVWAPVDSANVPPRARKLPKQTRSKILVQSIKEATVIVVKKFGSTDVQASTICDVAGIAMGSLYQYFVNVESIFASIYEDAIKQKLERAFTEDEPVATLMALHQELKELDRFFNLTYYHSHYSKGLNALFGVPLHGVSTH